MALRPGTLEREWKHLERQEARYLNKKKESRPSFLNQKLEQAVPEKLHATLNAAFVKAFEVVFEKGTDIIEKTYNKKQHEQSFKVNSYAVRLEQSKKHVKAFAKQAGRSRNKNLLVSGIEGAGLGLLGIGIPDIPIFTAVLLKSIYEIALSYGTSYDTEEEKIFILKLIWIALLHGEELQDADQKLNDWILKGVDKDADRREYIKKAADALSSELLYMKFLQGIPLVGVAGGLADTVCLKKITDYADLKYKRKHFISL